MHREEQEQMANRGTEQGQEFKYTDNKGLMMGVGLY